MFGIASRYVEARSKALPCIFKYTMKSRSFSFSPTKRDASPNESDFVAEKSLTNCPLSFGLYDLSATTEFAGFRDFAWRTIPRRFSREEKTE